MTYFILAASALLLLLFATDVTVGLIDRRRSDKGRVHLQPYFAFCGGICGTLLLIPTIITALSDEPIWIPCTFLGFSLLCGVISMAHLNCRVTYDEEGFTHKNFIGIKRTFTYREITGIRERPSFSDSLLYVGRRRVVVETLAVGGMQFEWHLRKRYRSLNGGRAIPEIKPKRGDLFNGHVDDAGGLIFAYSLVSLLCIGMLTFVTVYTWFRSPTPESCDRLEVVFETWNEEGNTLYLRPADGMKYELRYMDEGIDRDAIKSICDGQTAVTVYGKQYTPDEGEDFRLIYALAQGDTYLVNFEDAARLHVRGNWPIVALFGGFTLIWAVFVFFSIRVGRNPERYSKRVIRLFFKDGYVH